MIYFTSDLHFCHPFVAQKRGFKDYKHHDCAVVKNINSMVGKNDELYILGDMSCGNNTSFIEAIKCVDKLNVIPSHRHLILGNHESFKLKPVWYSVAYNRFVLVSTRDIIQPEPLNGTPIVMTHVPPTSLLTKYLEEPLSHREKEALKHSLNVDEAVHLYGHTHQSTPLTSGTLKYANIGLDAWNPKPVSLDRITEVLRHN